MKFQVFSILVFLLLIPMLSTSQELGLFCGYNANKYFDYNNNFKDNYHAYDGYPPSIGWSLGAVLMGDRKYTTGYRLTCALEKFKGGYYYNYTANGGGYEYSVNTEKTTLSISFQPLFFEIKETSYLCFGLDFCFLIKDKTTGYESGWSYNNGSYSKDLEISDNFSKPLTMGLSGCYGIDFYANEKWCVNPHVFIYYGLTNEFNYSDLSKTKAFRITCGIAVKRKN